jgi:cysteine sulfinate desulfinase/cysteine desulfurase-like protein
MVGSNGRFRQLTFQFSRRLEGGEIVKLNEHVEITASSGTACTSKERKKSFSDVIMAMDL